MKALTASFTQTDSNPKTRRFSASLALSLFSPSIFTQTSLHHIKRQQSTPSLAPSPALKNKPLHVSRMHLLCLHSSLTAHLHKHTANICDPSDPSVCIYIYMRPLPARLSVLGMLKGTQQDLFSANFPLMFLSIAVLTHSKKIKR